MTKSRSKPGFALLVAIMLMGFLLAVLLGLSALIQVELATAHRENMRIESQNLAILGLNKGLGELQKFAGNDQRITATADLFTGASVNPTRPGNKYYTGVWQLEGVGTDSVDQRRGQPEHLAWLVSGALEGDGPDLNFHNSFDKDNPSSAGTGVEDSVIMVGEGTLNDANGLLSDEYVYAGQVALDSDTKTDLYAFWIGDEGTKARINLEGNEASNSMVDRARQLMPAINNLSSISDFEDLDYSALSQSSILGRVGNIDDLAIINQPYDDEYGQNFHGLTTWSESLLVDVANGGLKKDLSIAFEIDNDDFQNSEFTQEIEGDIDPDSPLESDYEVVTDHGGWTDQHKFVYNAFPEDGDGNQYHDLPDAVLPKQEPSPFRGPTWSLLREHYRMYHDVDDPNKPTFSSYTAHPNRNGDGVIKSNPDKWYGNYGHFAYFGPFNGNENNMSTLLDQRLNNNDGSTKFIPRTIKAELAPRLVRLIFYYSLTVDEFNNIRLICDPIVVLHNPYSVSLELEGYRVLMEKLDLGFYFQWVKPDGGTETLDNRTRQSLFRIQRVQAGNKQDAYQLNYNFICTQNGETNSAPINFEPGEIKYFSVDHNEPVEASRFALMLKEGITHMDGGLYYDKLNGKNTIQMGLTTVPAINFRIAHDAGGDNDGPDKRKRNPQLNWTRNEVGSVHTYLLDQEDLSDPRLIEDAGKVFREGQFSSIIQLYTDNYLCGVLDGFWSDVNTIRLSDLQSGKFFVAAYDIYMKTSQDEVKGMPTSILSNHNPRAQVFRGDHVGSGSNALRIPYNWQMEAVEFTGGVASFDGLTFGEDSNAFWGGGLTEGTGGVSHIALFEVPTTPLLSLGQLQHANTQNYMWEPGYVFGNSRASPYIRRDRISDNSLNRGQGQDAEGSLWQWQFDVSYLMNEALADSYFLSSLTPGFSENGEAGSISDLKDEIEGLNTGETDLLNSRYVFSIPETLTEEDFESQMDLALYASEENQQSDMRPHDTIAAYLRVNGGFNVNSTSIEAWTAFLSGLNGTTLQRMSGDSMTSDIIEPGNTPFPRMTLSGEDDTLSANLTNPWAWNGYRTLSNDELETLATAIVDEIRLRAQAQGGPYPSMARFLNRELIDRASDSEDIGIRGLLQAAIDKSGINATINSIGDTPVVTKDSLDAFTTLHGLPDDQTFAVFREPEHFASSSMDAVPQTITQADLYTQMAPFANVRSDTFRIRAAGIKKDPFSGLEVKSWCEAIVQRQADFVNSDVDNDGNSPIDFIDDLGDVNRDFGRRFKIISFRWLDENQI